MKYMIVTQTFPPRTGGMQNVMDSISKRLSVSNETHIFPDHYLSKEYSSTNLNIHIHNNFSPKIFRPFIKKFLLKVICKSSDIIICDSWKSLNAVPKTINKVYVFAHGQEFLSKEKKIKKIKKSLDRASCIICSSNYTSSLIDKLKITNTKKIVIPPTYSLEKSSEKKTKSRKNSKTVSLLTICRLEKRKGILPVLRCLSNLNKNKLLKPFQWNICGEGLQFEEIRENIKKLNLTDQVFLIGKINNNLKQKFLESSDVFVMPSYKVNESIEGFGISYIEAAAFRIPSIAGLDGGVKDAVIDTKTGWCVDPLNQEQLAIVLKEAINDENQRKKYGIHAEKHFLQSFLGEKVFRKFMDTISI